MIKINTDNKKLENYGNLRLVRERLERGIMNVIIFIYSSLHNIYYTK